MNKKGESGLAHGYGKKLSSNQRPRLVASLLEAAEQRENAQRIQQRLEKEKHTVMGEIDILRRTKVTLMYDVTCYNVTLRGLFI